VDDFSDAQTIFRKFLLESGIDESRKRNDQFEFFELLSEFATMQKPQNLRNALFWLNFNLKRSLGSLLARALNCAMAENCKVVREVC
jgi:hypothetical protein